MDEGKQRRLPARTSILEIRPENERPMGLQSLIRASKHIALPERGGAAWVLIENSYGALQKD